MLKRAVHCFQQQTYPNRELIVSCESDDYQSRAIVDNLNDPSVRAIQQTRAPGIFLGQLRNEAIAECSGEYVCCWDDDDWFAKDRLARQWHTLDKEGRPACVLSRLICLDVERAQAFLGRRRAWEPSILCEREVLTQYPNLPRGEDTVVVARLLIQDRLALLDAPWLYLYVYHGGNTWDRQHWQHVLTKAQPLSNEECQQLLASVRARPWKQPDGP
jgi:glycosyltransferase involved in cell wall biosynthesis